MKLLFDENLSPKLAWKLGHLYPGSAHVHKLGLGAADDGAVWTQAALDGFVIVSKDIDFFDRSALYGSPPKLIWLRTGNCSTNVIEEQLIRYHAAILRFDKDEREAVLILP